ncbi:DUF4190 domain-containing protein [Arthrobacter sp. GCM10027362]|uniref:DUF4190 domain-containing protein n=1 Tax=Arthrobacter sp. GCM10027362 TaxID=3273379 RepID=UPI003641524B
MSDQTPRPEASAELDPQDRHVPEGRNPDGESHAGRAAGGNAAPQQGAAQDIYTRYPQLSGHDYAAGPPQPMGLAIAALVIGIVSFMEAAVPIVGVASFLIGPLAIVFGIIALRKKQKKPMAITGIVLGAAGMIIAAIVSVMVVYFANQIIGAHTVRYVVTSDGPATVAYFNGSETVREQISGNWEKDISYTGLPYASVSVDSPGTAAVGCHIQMDGSSATTNSGTGQVDCVSGNMQFWRR